MQKTLVLTFLFGLTLPLTSQAAPLDSFRAEKVTAEVQDNGLGPSLTIFKGYVKRSAASEQKATKALLNAVNTLQKKYPTVDLFYKLTKELTESGYYQREPALLVNLNTALKKMKTYGFGSGKLSPFKVTSMQSCGKRVPVFVATVIHPTKSVPFGFYLSDASGFTFGNEIRTKTLNQVCES